jgi:hypothetical protein
MRWTRRRRDLAIVAALAVTLAALLLWIVFPIQYCGRRGSCYEDRATCEQASRGECYATMAWLLRCTRAYGAEEAYCFDEERECEAFRETRAATPCERP